MRIKKIYGLVNTTYEREYKNSRCYTIWEQNKSFDVIEIASRLHHRAVQIHPFLNGNGRWSRMLANIYLKQNGLSPTRWNENLLSKENLHRDDYIKALKKADDGDYIALIKMQGNIL